MVVEEVGGEVVEQPHLLTQQEEEEEVEVACPHPPAHPLGEVEELGDLHCYRRCVMGGGGWLVTSPLEELFGKRHPHLRENLTVDFWIGQGIEDLKTPLAQE